MGAMEWNEETISRLRALWDEGHSTAEIGRRLGITKNAVVGKAHRLTLPARPSPIRRSAAGTLPRRSVVRRTVGPTLSPVAKAAEAAPQASPGVREAVVREAVVREAGSREAVVREVGVREVGVPERPRVVVAAAAVPGASVLRAVPASPRPMGRVAACCWPTGEPGTPSFHFCGAGAVAGKPYCAEHVAIAYVKVRDRREDAA